jgi:membrane fusion protein (multidrug efflux system)
VDRYAALLKINGVSRQEYDLNVLAANTIKADMNIVRTNMAKTTLRAPFSGKMGLGIITNGAYVTPQTVIAILRKVSTLKLEFMVPEKYGPDMKPGNLIHFTIENNPFNYVAKIAATENNIAAETRSLKVLGVVMNGSNNLIPGAFAKVKIPLGENSTGLMIPSQAIIPQARDKKVIVVRNGLASYETVTTGTRDSSMVEIVTGLKSGDTVLITGLLATKPGSKVQLNNLKKQ